MARPWAQRRRNRHPLRLVVDSFADPATSALKERLECGHVQGVRQDIFGDTNAVRRRCRQCVK
jgi:hypothetical protein